MKRTPQDYTSEGILCVDSATSSKRQKLNKNVDISEKIKNNIRTYTNCNNFSGPLKFYT